MSYLISMMFEFGCRFGHTYKAVYPGKCPHCKKLGIPLEADKMSALQETFNIVYKHLLTQGEKSEDAKLVSELISKHFGYEDGE